MGNDDCDKPSASNYDECERVRQWHVVFCCILVALNLIVAALVTWVSHLFWKWRHLTLIRFRGPTLVVAWAFCSHLYGISRIIYAGYVVGVWSYSRALDSASYGIRAIGQNGLILLYVLRGFHFFHTYRLAEELSLLNEDPNTLALSKNSREVLRQHKQESQSSMGSGTAQMKSHSQTRVSGFKLLHNWTQTEESRNGCMNFFLSLCQCDCCLTGISVVNAKGYDKSLATPSWPIRLKSTLGSEKWLAKATICYMLLMSAILTSLRAVDASYLEGFSQVYFGVTFLAVLILSVRLSKMRDRLGLVREYMSFFVLSLLATFVAWMVLTLTQNTTKRVLAWFGNLLLQVIGVLLTFYVPFIRYREWDNIQNTGGEALQRSKRSRGAKILARLLLDKNEGLQVFNRFLKGIYCQENLDFLITVACFKAKVEALSQFQLNAFSGDALEGVEEGDEEEDDDDEKEQEKELGFGRQLFAVISTRLSKGSDLEEAVDDDNNYSTDTQPIVGGSMPLPSSPLELVSLRTRSNSDQIVSTKSLSSKSSGKSPIGSLGSHTLRRVLSGAVDKIRSGDSHLIDDPVDAVLRSVQMPDGSDMRVIDVQLFRFDDDCLPHPELLTLPLREWPAWIYAHYVQASAPYAVNTQQQQRDKVRAAIHTAAGVGMAEDCDDEKMPTSPKLEAKTSTFAKLTKSFSLKTLYRSSDRNLKKEEAMDDEMEEEIEAAEMKPTTTRSTTAIVALRTTAKSSPNFGSFTRVRSTSTLQMDGARVDVFKVKNAFDTIQSETFQLMARDSLSHFMYTPAYEQWQDFQTKL